MEGSARVNPNTPIRRCSHFRSVANGEPFVNLFTMAVSVSLAFGLILPSVSLAETVLYCVEKHAVGMVSTDGNWHPSYGDEATAKRHTIRINENFSVLSGVDGTTTPFFCHSAFPNKAPEVLTCFNAKVAMMQFNYNTETGNFLLAMLSPGGWLSEGTEREDEIGLFGDHIILGHCQTF